MKEILDKLRKLSGKTKSKRMVMFLTVLLSVFLIFQIFFSQNLSPLFFGLTNNNKESIVSFMQKIRLTSDFPQQLNYFENIYGSAIKNEIFFKEIAQNQKITKFEQILKNNNQARDILYSLFLLYKEKGDNLKAEKYLRLAKEVDPNIK